LAERRRDSDLLARQGGDEFLLLLTDLERMGAEQTASRAAEGLLRSLASPFVIAGAEFHIGASVGIALYPKDAALAEELLSHADAAMYQAKADGRNTVCVYRDDPHEPLERLSMTSRLRKAITRGEFVLYWQPIVDPADGSLKKLEVLIRWQDPLRGLVLPGEFIEFAEETGFIDRIGDWVVAAASAQIGRWRGDGLDVPPVTINVSPRQLRRPDFGDRMRRAIGSSCFEHDLMIEITESVAMANAERTEAVLSELAELGIGVAVDDFGLGYSSLARLRELPVQMIKVDRSFLIGVPEDPQASALVSAIIELASALELTAVAEGVETDDQRRFLVQQGCPLAQGFLLGRPMPAEKIREMLAGARGDPDPLLAS
jgi:predicted signal transduction protein with EAL and GGDEF domain